MLTKNRHDVYSAIVSPFQLSTESDQLHAAFKAIDTANKIPYNPTLTIICGMAGSNYRLAVPVREREGEEERKIMWHRRTVHWRTSLREEF